MDLLVLTPFKTNYHTFSRHKSIPYFTFNVQDVNKDTVNRIRRFEISHFFMSLRNECVLFVKCCSGLPEVHGWIGTVRSGSQRMVAVISKGCETLHVVFLHKHLRFAWFGERSLHLDLQRLQQIRRYNHERYSWLRFDEIFFSNDNCESHALFTAHAMIFVQERPSNTHATGRLKNKITTTTFHRSHNFIKHAKWMHRWNVNQSIHEHSNKWWDCIHFHVEMIKVVLLNYTIPAYHGFQFFVGHVLNSR
jgi:hypothetical protein